MKPRFEAGDRVFWVMDWRLTGVVLRVTEGGYLVYWVDAILLEHHVSQLGKVEAP